VRLRPPARPASCAPPLASSFTAVALLLALLAFATVTPAASLAVHVLTADGRPLRGAVVQVHSLDAPLHRVAPVHAVMDQVNRAFEPDLLVIPVGSSISFPNSDSVSHQIYSFSPVRRFQLPLYQGKPYPPVEFDQSGIVTLGCNIHDQMLAYVVVTDAAYFGRTDPQGLWSGEVNAGRYRVTVWHPRLREDAAMLTADVAADDNTRGDATIRLKKPLQPVPLTDRPYSWEY
jgi:plastocyanin